MDKKMKRIQWESIMPVIFILTLFFVGLGAGYTKGSIDTLTALNPTIKQGVEVMIYCQNKLVDCEKELWMDERNRNIKEELGWFCLEEEESRKCLEYDLNSCKGTEGLCSMDCNFWSDTICTKRIWIEKPRGKRK